MFGSNCPAEGDSSQSVAFLEEPAGDRMIDPLETDSGRWWVLHTRSRHEKAVASVLEGRRIRHYLPLVRTERSYGGRRVDVDLPLFSGYLFLCGGADACDVAWKTNKLAQIIHVEDQQQIRGELHQIFRIVESGQPVDLYPSLCEGRRCRIKSGPLRGVEGVVLQRRKRWRMCIAATILGQSAMIEIDAANLEAVD